MASKLLVAVALSAFTNLHQIYRTPGKIDLPDSRWKALLTPQEYQVTRHGDTEPPFTGALLVNHGHGVYRCVCCGNPLFRSEAKFESGTGWPSFFAPISRVAIETRVDRSLPLEVRTEVLCSRCHAHLGHVFDDGPPPTGLRYCMNSAALLFEPTPR